MTKKTTLSTQCHNKLKAEILQGEILPGERLRCEELKKRFDVGMSPVREALSTLAAEDLIILKENKGYSVKKMTSAEVVDAIYTFAEIECLCFRHSIENGDDEWESNIVAALHRLKKLETLGKVDYSLWAPANHQFHSTLVSKCPITGLLYILSRCVQQHQWLIHLAYKFSDTSKLRVNHKEHFEIGTLAIERKTSKAVEKMYQHITGGIDNLRENLLKHNLIEEDL